MAEKNAVELFDMKVAHVGINANDDKEALQFAEKFLSLMGLQINETPVSYFNDSLIEIMKKNGRGTNGHIGFAVNDCEKAMKYFEDRGMKTVEETKKFDKDGKCTFVYFDGDIGGCAVHLIQK